MAERIRAHDWSATPLGPIAGWSERLKMLIEQALANPLVSTIACGPQHLLVYNDAAARHFGSHHPAALGQAMPDTFPEGWATVAPFYGRAFAGETVRITSQPLDTRGEGVPTDVFDALLTPMRESDGHIAYVHMTGAEVGGRAQMEAALRESETRHRLLIESWSQAVPDGKVTVRWTTFEKRGAPWLAFDWIEAGAPTRPQASPDVPRRRGFGSELIEGRIPYELRGRGQVTIEPVVRAVIWNFRCKAAPVPSKRAHRSGQPYMEERST